MVSPCGALGSALRVGTEQGKPPEATGPQVCVLPRKRVQVSQRAAIGVPRSSLIAVTDLPGGAPGSCGDSPRAVPPGPSWLPPCPVHGHPQASWDQGGSPLSTSKVPSGVHVGWLLQAWSSLPPGQPVPRVVFGPSHHSSYKGQHSVPECCRGLRRCDSK